MRRSLNFRQLIPSEADQDSLPRRDLRFIPITTHFPHQNVQAHPSDRYPRRSDVIFFIRFVRFMSGTRTTWDRFLQFHSGRFGVRIFRGSTLCSDAHVILFPSLIDLLVRYKLLMLN